MSEKMLAIGDYRLSIDTAAYQQLQKKYAYRWATVERLSQRPAKQFISLGEETMQFKGTILFHYKGGLNQVEAMNSEAKKGEPLKVVDGLGLFWGRWVIDEISETRTFFIKGGLPLKIEFKVALSHYGEDGL